MARGWESKSVESQIADRGASEGPAVRRSAAERDLMRRRSGLELSRARVIRELEVTTAPLRRSALEAALAHLDGELATLGEPGS